MQGTIESWEESQKLLNYRELQIIKFKELDQLVGKYFRDSSGGVLTLVRNFSISEKKQYTLKNYGQTSFFHQDIWDQQAWKEILSGKDLVECKKPESQIKIIDKSLRMNVNPKLTENGDTLNNVEVDSVSNNDELKAKVGFVCEEEKALISDCFEKGNLANLETDGQGKVKRILLTFKTDKKKSIIWWNDIKWILGLKDLEGFGWNEEVSLDISQIKEIFGAKAEFYLHHLGQGWIKILQENGNLKKEYQGKLVEISGYTTGKVVCKKNWEGEAANWMVVRRETQLTKRSASPIVLEEGNGVKVAEEAVQSVVETQKPVGGTDFFFTLQETEERVKAILAEWAKFEDQKIQWDLRREVAEILDELGQALNPEDFLLWNLGLPESSFEKDTQGAVATMMIRDLRARVSELLGAIKQGGRASFQEGKERVKAAYQSLVQAAATEAAKIWDLKIRLEVYQEESDQTKYVRVGDDLMTIKDALPYCETLLNKATKTQIAIQEKIKKFDELKTAIDGKNRAILEGIKKQAQGLKDENAWEKGGKLENQRKWSIKNLKLKTKK